MADSTIPTPAEIVAARKASGLSQPAAAALVYLSSGQRWSEYERGTQPMDPARFELFVIKCGLHPRYKPARGVPVPRATAAA